MVVGAWFAQVIDHVAAADWVLVLALLDLAGEAVDGEADADGAAGEGGCPFALEVHRVGDVLLEALDQAGQRLQVFLLAEDLRFAVEVGDAEVPGGSAGG